MSLRTKLVLWYTGVFGVSGGLLVVALYVLIAHKLWSEADTFLVDEYQEWVGMTLASLDDIPRLEAAIRREISDESLFPLTYRLHDTARQQDPSVTSRSSRSLTRSWRSGTARAAGRRARSS